MDSWDKRPACPGQPRRLSYEYTAHKASPMSDILLFWKARPDLAMPEDAVARELNWGEEVEGLIDLPVKEIIDRLKAEFRDRKSVV